MRKKIRAKVLSLTCDNNPSTVPPSHLMLSAWAEIELHIMA